jgi:hypothetical protein
MLSTSAPLIDLLALSDVSVAPEGTTRPDVSSKISVADWDCVVDNTVVICSGSAGLSIDTVYMAAAARSSFGVAKFRMARDALLKGLPAA